MMKILDVRIVGFRGFNEEQIVEFPSPLCVFEGPNGSGKTSIGEAVEWLLYGKTVKRAKGEDLSKREYNGCYRNVHFPVGQQPFVEARIEVAGSVRTVRRELYDDESSVLFLDGSPSNSLQPLGISTLYDRPLILQHTLQDFIFMKPKARYEVLSALLGLEPLVTFRNAVEQAKTDFRKRLPPRYVDAERRRGLLIRELRAEPILVPVATCIEAGTLDVALEHLTQVASGLVAQPATGKDLVPALKAARAQKERAQLDWGRFSASIVDATATAELAALSDRGAEQLQHAREELASVAAERGVAHEAVSPAQKQFFEHGLRSVDPSHDTRCPFCAADTLTPERVAEIRTLVGQTPGTTGGFARAESAVALYSNTLAMHRTSLWKTIPRMPTQDERATITELADTTAAADFFAAIGELEDRLRTVEESETELRKGLAAVEGAFQSGLDATGIDLVAAHTRYTAVAAGVPVLVNAYIARYSALDPHVRSKLSSAADVQKLERATQALEQWFDVQLAESVRLAEESLQQLIRKVRSVVERKQKEILATRDTEIRAWYGMLNPGADVAYDGILTGTDSLELHARTFSKKMMAAPNLSTSQLNCIGLAVYLACVTRSGTPFKTLLIDDPVQSMDEEHSEAFKKQVMTKLLDDDFHVVVLTHMQPLAGDIEALYRKRGAVRYKMAAYTLAGPSIEFKGPELVRMLDAVKKNKDATNEQYRRDATLHLRMFVERFVKDLYVAETCKPVSKTYESKSWSELNNLLRQVTVFDSKHEPILQDTHTFTSRHLHTDDTVPQKVPNSAQLNSHYIAMKGLLEQYKSALSL